MNLTIDIGNTLTKMAVIENGQVVDTFKVENIRASDIATIFESYPAVKAAIMVSSKGQNTEIEDFVKSKVGKFINFDHTVKVPIKNLYKTPETLGSDRLAAAVGAMTLYPEHNTLIVDFGTAITIDMVSDHGEFLGGNISAGASTRFRALHQYTTKLPMCALSEQTELLGGTSNEAIESGVILGIVYEIEGYIRDLSKKYSDLRIIFTGGDGNFFAKRFKNPIFATYDLVAYGLNRILEYDAD